MWCKQRKEINSLRDPKIDIFPTLIFCLFRLNPINKRNRSDLEAEWSRNDNNGVLWTCVLWLYTEREREKRQNTSPHAQDSSGFHAHPQRTQSVRWVDRESRWPRKCIRLGIPSRWLGSSCWSFVCQQPVLKELGDMRLTSHIYCANANSNGKKNFFFIYRARKKSVEAAFWLRRERTLSIRYSLPPFRLINIFIIYCYGWKK